MSSLGKQYYTIQELSEMLGVPASTLRYWETQFPQLRPTRTSGGQRRYTKENIKIVEQIKNLLHGKGLKIETVREILTRYAKNPPRLDFTCKTPRQAINLLGDLQRMTQDEPYVSERIGAVLRWVLTVYPNP